MSGKYFYAINGVRQGPVAFDDLKSLIFRGELKRSDLIWTQGMPAWKSASSVTELFEGLPPDIGQAPATPLPTHTPAPATAAMANLLPSEKSGADTAAKPGLKIAIDIMGFLFGGCLTFLMLMQFLGLLFGNGEKSRNITRLVLIGIIGLLSGTWTRRCIKNILR